MKRPRLVFYEQFYEQSKITYDYLINFSTPQPFIDVTYEVVEEPKEVKLITDGLDT